MKLSTTLPALALLAASAHAATRELVYTFTPDQGNYTCAANDITVDCGQGSYGSCVSNSDGAAPMMWCCMAVGEICWGWMSDCDLPGRKKCRKGDYTWCCDAELEECDNPSICHIKPDIFPNPLSEAIYPSPAGLEAETKTVVVEIEAVETSATATGRNSTMTTAPGTTTTAAETSATETETETESDAAPSETGAAVGLAAGVWSVGAVVVAGLGVVAAL